MAAPDYVPSDPTEQVRKYTSPPRRDRSWSADRPADFTTAGQPEGTQLGTQGPDQGYALKLAGMFEDRVHLGNLHWEDVMVGCVAVAMKRAALYGRAPVIHDLTAAFTIYGFLDEAPDQELVGLRERLFPEVRSHHHYREQREIADLVTADTLMRPHSAIETFYGLDWKQNFGAFG